MFENLKKKETCLHFQINHVYYYCLGANRSEFVRLRRRFGWKPRSRLARPAADAAEARAANRPQRAKSVRIQPPTTAAKTPATGNQFTTCIDDRQILLDHKVVKCSHFKKNN